jgi:hypothetical protein
MPGTIPQSGNYISMLLIAKRILGVLALESKVRSEDRRGFKGEYKISSGMIGEALFMWFV